MSNIVAFKSKAPQPAAPRGVIDISIAHDGMVLVDGCLPVAVLAEILKIAETAGVTIRDMID